MRAPAVVIAPALYTPSPCTVRMFPGKLVDAVVFGVRSPPPGAIKYVLPGKATAEKEAGLPSLQAEPVFQSCPADSATELVMASAGLAALMVSETMELVAAPRVLETTSTKLFASDCTKLVIVSVAVSAPLIRPPLVTLK